MDASFDECLLELIDENLGAGGLFNVSIEETVLCFLSCMGVLEALVELHNESVPSGEVGGLWVLPNEFKLVFHPLLGSSPHETQSKPDLLLVVHWTENKVIPACNDISYFSFIFFIFPFCSVPLFPLHSAPSPTHDPLIFQYFVDCCRASRFLAPLC